MIESNAILREGTGIDIVYDDLNGTITITNTGGGSGGGGGGLVTDPLTDWLLAIFKMER